VFPVPPESSKGLGRHFELSPEVALERAHTTEADIESDVQGLRVGFNQQYCCLDESQLDPQLMKGPARVLIEKAVQVGAVDGAPPLGKGELERFVERSSFEQGPTGRQRRVAVAAPPDRLDRLAEHIDLDL
jgi:hypothetical protein